MTDDPSSHFRSALLAAHPYVVGGTADVSAKLNQNESPFDLPVDLKSELAAQIQAVHLNRYPSEQPEGLVATLADYAGVSPEQVLASHGSNEFVHTLCLSIVEPGVEVVLPTPMFSLFRSTVLLFGGTCREVACRSDFTFDIDAIVNAVSSDARLTILACPNNPTGKDIGLADMERILDAADGIVVVDEAYWEFTRRESAVELLDRHPNLVVMRTLSKAFGLAAVRIGYVIASPAVIGQFLKARLPFMIDPIAEQIATAVVKSRDRVLSRVDEILNAKADLEASLRDLDGVTVVSSDTNFVLFNPGTETDVIREELARQGVVVRSMAGYRELQGYLRANTGTFQENQRFVDALKNALFRHAPGG